MLTSVALDHFEKRLAAGKEDALLRFSLGNECFKLGRFDDACPHLRACLVFDPHYSAAWKLLGKALNEAGAPAEALEVYRLGIASAEAKGDIQAAKEMRVFARRIDQKLT
jgi:predicted Zn-dependent protease